jgi:hypothetical protein
MIPKILLKLSLLVLCFSSLGLYAQTVDSEAMRLGLYGGYDFHLNSSDKILRVRPQRRLCLGLTFSPKTKKFIAFGGAGLKMSKLHLFTPQLTSGFKNSVQSNLIDYSHLTGHDSLVARTMDNITKGTSEFRIKGSYHQFMQLGFIINRGLSPSFMFYYGSESILLQAPFTLSTDENGEFNYISMNSDFLEFSFGVSYVFDDEPMALNLRVGFVQRRYGNFNISGVGISEYTSGDIGNDYARTRNINISISFLGWSNWVG